MRFLYAVLCVLLVSLAAFGQNKAPAQAPGLDGKVSVLERKVATLEKQVKALRDANYLKANPGSGVITVPPQVLRAEVGWGQCSCGFGQCPCQGGNGCGCGMGSFAAPSQTPQQVTVCQNGVCRVVSSPSQFQSQSSAVAGCSSCSQSGSSGGWYLGKNLGRRR